MKKRIAFTMSEAMIVLGIVAVLATLSVIAVNSAKPDENIIMFRRAYGTTLKVVQNLMSDSQLYPNATVVAYSDDDSNLNPLWQKSLALTCSNEYLTGDIDMDKTETGSRAIDNDWALDYLTNCGGGGGGGGSSTTSNGLQTGTVNPTTNYCLKYVKSSPSDPDICEAATSNYAVCKSDCSYTCASTANSYYDAYGNLICVAPCSSDKIWSASKKECVDAMQSSYSLSTNGLMPELTSGGIGISSTGTSSSTSSSTSSGTSSGTSSSGTSSGISSGISSSFSSNGRVPISSDILISSNGIVPISSNAFTSSGPLIIDTSYDSGYDFDSLATTVFGKGFSDTEITDKMKQRYPYLASATADNKFAYSFMSRLNPIESTVSGSTTKFTTADGIYWEVIDRFNTNSPHAMVTVYLNGNTDGACYYNSKTCQTPNKFTFRIAKSGRVTHQLDTSNVHSAGQNVNDPMACSYARYSSVTKNSKIPTEKTVNSCFKTYFETQKAEFDN